jgi:very-short-patch-repair endonuclease
VSSVDRKTIKRARALRKNMTKAEVLLWQQLRRRQVGGFKFRRQMPVGPYIADFACAERRLIVEVDGATHAEDDEMTYDARRTAYIETQGWTVHRVWNSDVYENMSGVIEGLLLELERLDDV